MRWAVVVLALVASPVLAQVAGLCGPGRVCSARALRLSEATTAVCVRANSTTGVSFETDSSANVYAKAYSGPTCGGGAFGQYLYAYTSTLGLISSTTTGAWSGLTSGQTGTGTAFASFPTCNAGASGRLLYDSTNNRWRFCDGTAWQFVGQSAGATQSANWTTMCTASPCTTENADLSGSYSPRATGEKSVSGISCNAREAGSGGTTGVVVRVVENGTTELCSCTIGTCAGLTSANRCSCAAGTLTAGNVYTVQLKNTTDCTTNPGTLVCNTD